MELVLDQKQLWDSVLVEIELSVSKATFNTWFRGTYISKIDEGTVFLIVPNIFARDWLSQKYNSTILKHLRNLSATIHGVEYVISKEDGRGRAPERDAPTGPTRELPLQDYYINKEDNLNPRYTFDSFVVGSFNELAHAASQAVLRKPGIVYNPLFVYGSTGLGKTHLIQAIGNHIKHSFKDKRVLYVTSERFASDIINAIQTGKINHVKDKYRKYDVLIMDDIQFLSNKEKTQEELFHLFNTLYDNNKQIVFSSDKHPNFIPNLEDRLKSRFAAGMTVDIPTPDHESRVAILRTKAASGSIPISEEILDYLAHAITGNIRDLEGIINSVSMQSQLKGRELVLHEVKTFIKTSTKPKKAISIKEIVKIVADFYQIEEGSIYEKTRRKEIIKPRQVAMYLLREDFSVSYPSIGQKLGGRDHTTVIHSCEKIKTDIKGDAVLLDEINQLRSLIV